MDVQLHPMFAWEYSRGQIPESSCSQCRPEGRIIVKRHWTGPLGRVPFSVMPTRLLYSVLSMRAVLSGPDFAPRKMRWVKWSWKFLKALSSSRPVDHWGYSFSEFSQQFHLYCLYSDLQVQTEKILMLDGLDFIPDFNYFICIELYKYLESSMPSILTGSTKLPCEDRQEATRPLCLALLLSFWPEGAMG